MENNLSDYIDNHTLSAKDKQAFVFDFGKYKDHHILDVFSDDPQYIRFIYRKARYRLSPQITRFIIDNASVIREAIAQQELNEKDVF